METAKDIARRLDNQQLARTIRALTSKYGWSNTAKTLREVVFVHVGWNSDFTELDNVLRKIEQDFQDNPLGIPGS